MLTIDDPATVAELTEMADRYETALMANDVETLDALFRNAPETIRYGVGEVLYGFAEIAAFRQGRVGGSPQRRVLRRVVTSFGPDLGTVNLEFQREGGTRIGRQSQTWVRTDAGWKITCAHVSLMADIS
ncbi:oxalurate catabolism protein HpxZ [Nguyenibacter vanlangensis]|uniref:Oxalurate catabolism protein HpxZ n=1 Tax=Nguyenibacter vanlangensis TaxID=1216886 RepID=A0ABZ3D364_9PROT